MTEPQITYKLEKIKEKIEHTYEFNKEKVNIEDQIYTAFFNYCKVDMSEFDSISYRIIPLEYDLDVMITLKQGSTIKQKFLFRVHF